MTNRPGPLGFALVAVAIGTAILSAAVPQSDRVTLAVMRRDGAMVPFAAFDGDWSLPWPTNIRTMELPITLDAVPRKWWGSDVPASWTLWPTGLRPSVELTVSAPVVVMVGMEKRLGIRTNFHSTDALPPPFEMPYPKEGLAVAGGVRVEAIGSVSNRAPAFRGFAATILDDIEAIELKTITGLKAKTRWVHPFEREARHQVPVELEAWYTSMLEQPGFSLSYIEAVKKYPPGPGDEGCGLETFISGWVHGNTRVEKPKTELSAKVTYCDRSGVTYLLPLGRMRLKNRTHWVFQQSSAETEWYVVAEATPGRVRYVAEYFGGVRPRLPF